MNGDDERDYAEEQYNRCTIHEGCAECGYINGHWRYCPNASQDPRWVRIGQAITEEQAARMIHGKGD